MVKVRDTLPRKSSGQVDLNAWLSHLPPQVAKSERLQKVCAFGQMQGAYFEQGLELVEILAELAPQEEILSAALVYPIRANARAPLDLISKECGQPIAKLIAGVEQMAVTSSLYNKKGERKLTSVDKLRRMILAMVEDVRVVLIKLADMIFRLRSAAGLPNPESLRQAHEAMEIYAPLANRLGIGHLKWELEDLAFRYLEPPAYKQIASWLDEKRMERERYIKEVVSILQKALKKNQIAAKVYGRAKHIFSIARKIRKKNLDYHQIYDIRAVRILVPDIKSCYAALGTVHTLWRYIPQEFDDYIATPKENGYRSLHTAVIGPEHKTLEIQIRTHEMHEEAELGVAAHWHYKEEGKVGARAEIENKIVWLRQVLEWQSELVDTNEFIQKLQSQAFSQPVYVFTPEGDVIDLVKGATPLDFAYAIHTELGHRCRGAKVNGRIVPLTYLLQTGETVEVLKAKEGSPSRDWLNSNLGFLKTDRAKSKVHQWFRAQNYEENAREGRALLEREFQRLGIEPVLHDKLAEHFGLKKGNDLLAAIGAGDIRVSQVAHALQVYLAPASLPSAPPATIKQRRAPPTPPKPGEISVQGESQFLTFIAGCCKPIPGESVIGYITKGKGVSIHRANCPNVDLARTGPSLHQQRLIEVQWSDTTHKGYEVNLCVLAYDRQGLLRDISKVLANERINITAVNTRSYQNSQTAEMTLTIEVNSLETLSRLMGQLEKIPNVFEVRRLNLS